MYEKNTDKLFEELKIKPDAEKFIAQNQNELTMSLHEYLAKLLQEKHLEKKDIVKTINKDDKHIYHIFDGSRNPSREKLLTISRAMQLNLDETQYLLRYGGFGILYPRNKWDAVVIAAIEKNLSIQKTNELLQTLGLPFLNEYKEKKKNEGDGKEL